MKVEHTEKRVTRLSVLLILVLYVTIQSFAVMAPFFAMDDEQELLYVTSLEGWWHLFGADAFQLFRPVKNLIFALFAFLPESMTPVCHGVAILIGCVSLFPVLAFFRHVFGSEKLALLASGIWILAPTLVSSVAWLSCVNIQLMCALGALTIVLHDKAFDGDCFRSVFIAAATVCLVLACVSYEQAVAVGPLVVLFDFYLRPERFKSRNAFQVYALYALVTVLYLLVRGSVGSTSSLNGSFDNVNRLGIMIASAYFTCWHFIVWLWPFGNMSPTGSYSIGDVSTLTLAACWIVVLALGILSLALRHRSSLLAMSIAFALVAFLPVSNILGFGNGPYGDYYMGLPSMGLSILVIVLCSRLLAAKDRLPCFTLGMLLAITRIFAVPEAARWAWLWSDGARAFESGIKAFPSTFANRQIYARVCYEREHLDELKECCDWLEVHLKPDSEQLGFVYLVRALVAMNVDHNANLAMANLDKVKRVDKKGAGRRMTSFYRGCVFEDLLGDEKSAEVEYRAAISGTWDVDITAAANRLARLLATRGELDEAEVLWEKAARYKPNDASIRHNLMQLKRQKALQ